jgi:hypothetical protein
MAEVMEEEMSIPRGIKLDRRLRIELQQINRKRGEAMMKAEYDTNVAILVAAADKRLRAEWGAPEIQADMAIMSKYHYAAPIGGANLRVYDRRTKCYDQTFGVEFKSPIMMPGTAYLYAGQKEEDRALYYECYVREADDDFEAVYALVMWHRERRAQITAEAETFYQAIRETASYAKIVERYPWLDTDEYRPFFATEDFPKKQRASRCVIRFAAEAQAQKSMTDAQILAKLAAAAPPAIVDAAAIAAMEPGDINGGRNEQLLEVQLPEGRAEGRAGVSEVPAPGECAEGELHDDRSGTYCWIAGDRCFSRVCAADGECDS